ncbi:hypothetical protein D9M71_166830 [compost metagenome]
MGQPIDQIQLGAEGIAGEVHHYVAAFSDAQPHPVLVAQGGWQQVAVVGDVGEALLPIAAVYQVELVEPTRAAVQHAEPVLAGSDPQHRLDDAVDRHLVPQYAFRVGLIPEQCAVRGEALVAEG